MKDLLLEIGTEEIPARFLEPALAAFQTLGRERLQKAGLTFKDVRVYGTPRRLAIVVEELSAKVLDQEQEFLGPAVAQAKDAEGNWTPAAQGFARSQGTTPERLGTRETDRGPRLVFLKKTPGAPTEKVLPTLLPDLIRSLSFPKSMVWEESRLAFARPIRWIVALYGIKPIAFSLAGVKAGRRTFGLRFHSPKPFDIPAPNRYAALLKNHCVIVDPAERRALIVKQIDHVAKAHHGHIPVEKFPDLLEEVSHLVEHPVAVVGKFDPRFLAVPKEVLVTSMKKHQKYFPVFKDASCSELLPFFVAVRNGLSDNQAVVREGYERVLTARLSDAAFFFSEHSKRPLASRVADLKGIAFLSPALTLGDKTDRVCQLTDQLCADIAGVSSDVRRDAVRIALLGKADLSTGLVGEFPELQGIVGRLYAERDGENAVVSRGIEEHYWPLTAEGILPSGESAAWVSVADKIDTLAGNFLIGKIPSGSQDPYGLRRAAVGVLRLLEAKDKAISLSDLVGRALNGLRSSDLGDPAKAGRALMDFFQQRWAALAETRGFRSDEVAAVAAAGFDDVSDAWARLTALRDVRRHPDFAPLSIAFKRAANLLKHAEKRGDTPSGDRPSEAVREDLFRTEAERTLGARVVELAASAEPLLAARDYPSVLSGLVSLRAAVDDFFVSVVVMDPDSALRENRLRLLSAVRTLFGRVADFSRLQETPSASSTQ
jgi:glycyl-tRNA synthetase beta chain